MLAKSSSEVSSRALNIHTLCTKLLFVHKKSFYPQFPPPHSSYPQRQGIKSSKKRKNFLARSEKELGSTWIENRLSTMAMGSTRAGKEEHCWRFQVCMFRQKVFPDNYFIRLNNNNKLVSFESFWQAICKSCLILY